MTGVHAKFKTNSRLKGLVSALLCAGLVACNLAACNKQQFGLQAASQEFAQRVKYSKAVDVLWVIDTSGSMSSHQTLLAQQMELFVTGLNASGLDYQMAVTTMDMSSTGEKGRFVAQTNTPVILTPTTPNLLGVLAGRIQLGDNGSPVERGLQAMMAALSSPLATTGANSGFLRSDSLLVINFLSNEDDTASPVTDSNRPVADYTSFLDSVRPPLAYGDRSWVANFMGVIQGDPSCTTMGQYSSYGLKYMALADASGGAKESICDGDLRSGLVNIKARILEVVTEYPLNREPSVSSIRVVVNGRAVPGDAQNGWTYYAAANSIRFHGTAVPAPESTIVVTFDPAGL
jgi:hypothetical protein